MENLVVVNPFEVTDVRREEAIAMWDSFEKYFSIQPGYVSAKLLESIGSDSRFGLVTVAEWKSFELFQAALSNPELEQLASTLPSDIPHYPGAYKIIRGV